MKISAPSYAPLKWLSIIWAIIGSVWMFFAWHEADFTGAIICLAMTVFVAGIWLRSRVSGILLLLLFAYSLIMRVTRVIQGDYPPIEIGVAFLHLLFVGVIGIWLAREWRSDSKRSTELNQSATAQRP